MSQNAGIVFGEDVAANINDRDYKNIYYSEVTDANKISEKLLSISKDDDYYLLRAGGIYAGATHSYAIENLKAGQYLVFTGVGANGGTFVINNPQNLTIDSWNTINNDTYTLKVESDGAVTFDIPRYCYLETLTLVDPAVSKTIPAESGYASFSADKAVTVPEDVTVYKAAVSAEDDAIVLTPVDTEVIPANIGVLLYSKTAGDKVFYTATEAATADFSGNELIATSVVANATGPTDGTYYALKAGVAEFAVINGGVELSANKAYIKAPENSEAKPMRMVIGGQTTGINEVDAADGAADGAYYTLQGVKVENPTKGLYIHNGKKVIIK